MYRHLDEENHENDHHDASLGKGAHSGEAGYNLIQNSYNQFAGS